MKDAIHGHNSATPGLHFPFSSSSLASHIFLYNWMIIFSTYAWLFIENSQGVQENSPRQAVARLGEFVA